MSPAGWQFSCWWRCACRCAALAGETHAGYAVPLRDAQALWVRALGATHETLGNAFIWLAGLHAAAALAHHYLLRDSTLARMVPRRS